MFILRSDDKKTVLDALEIAAAAMDDNAGAGSEKMAEEFRALYAKINK